MNNLIEEVHQLILTSYAGLGDQLAMRQHYQNMILLFKNELSLPLSPKVEALYQKLCR